MMPLAIATQVVYVIGSDEKPVKIGIANSISSRLRSLQIGNPDALVCHHFVRVPASRAMAVEQAAHSAFADRHRRGEWFNVHWREAAALLDDLAALEETAHQPGDLMTVLRAEYGMKAQGASAVWHYLDCQEQGHAYAPHANGYIMKRVGTAAYAAFSLVIAQQKPLSGLSPRERAAALKALAEAVNILCNFREQHERAQRANATRRCMEEIAAGDISLPRRRAAATAPRRLTGN